MKELIEEEKKEDRVELNQTQLNLLNEFSNNYFIIFLESVVRNFSAEDVGIILNAAMDKKIEDFVVFIREKFPTNTNISIFYAKLNSKTIKGFIGMNVFFNAEPTHPFIKTICDSRLYTIPSTSSKTPEQYRKLLEKEIVTQMKVRIQQWKADLDTSSRLSANKERKQNKPAMSP